MKENYRYTLAGLIITVLNLLSLPTFIIPLATIVPLGFPLELLFEKIFHTSDYSIIGTAVLISISVIFVLSLFFFFKTFKKNIIRENPLSIAGFIGFLILQMIIVHPLFFYLNTASDWSKASDGQFVMGIDQTFPFSSFFFFLFGIAADILKRKWSN